jgi:hypothetical protein
MAVVVVVDRGRGGMEPATPMGALSTAVTVDGHGSNGVVPAAIDDNDNMMALEAMAFSTDAGGCNGGCCH